MNEAATVVAEPPAANANTAEPTIEPRDAATQELPVEGGPAPPVQEEQLQASEAVEATVAQVEPAPAAAVTRGKGRPGKRGGGAPKRGNARAGAAGAAAASTTAGVGRGRGKRKSEAAQLAQEAGLAEQQVPEPRKRRKAAISARRIVESDGEVDEEADYNPSLVEAPYQPTPPEALDSAVSADAPALTTADSAQAQSSEAVTATVNEAAAPLPPPKKSLKVTLKSRRSSGQASASPTVHQTVVEPTAIQEDPVSFSAEPEPMPVAQVVPDEGPVVSSELPLKEAPSTLADLFGEDEPMLPASQLAEPSGLDTSETVQNPIKSPLELQQSDINNTVPLPKLPPQGKKAGMSSKFASTSTSPSKASPLPKKSNGSKPDVQGKPRPSGSGTPSTTTASSSSLMKKRLTKPNATASPRPTQTSSTPASAPQAESSFLDALFADTIPQTEHERQLRKERDEKARKAEALKALKAKKAKEDLESRRKIATAAAATASQNQADMVPAGTKPPPMTLPSLKTVTGQRQAGSSVLSRLGGSEKLRQQEIEKKRIASREQQRKLAEEGGFDLLSQGIEMAEFETPFLREWRLHQGMVFSGAGDGRPSQYYKGTPSADSDNHEPLRSLPHPWTFGSVFAFSGGTSGKSDDDVQSNPHQVPLEIGSELYVFEVFRPSSDISYSDEDCLWYRGYVVASRQPSHSTRAASFLDTSLDTAGRDTILDSGVAPEEPSVTVGIFPATHCLIKERLEDTDSRLETIRQSEEFAETSFSTHNLTSKERLAPLLEEDENQDEDVFQTLAGNLHTPSKARNRASLVDNRLSGHRRIASSSSAVEEVDRPSPPLPSLKTGDETVAGLEEPLVDEIACALRVSASSMYMHLLRRDYNKFREVKAATEYLHLGRRQLLNANLSTDELQRLRRDLVDKLVQSSIQQGSDIVVRHPLYGALADVDAHEQVDERAWMSGVRMYKLGVELAYTDPATGKRPIGSTSILGASTHIQSPHGVQNSENDSKSTASLSALPIFYHIYIDLKAFVASACTLGETAELIFSLYNKSEKRFLTEEFCIILNHQGVPRDGELDKARTLFRDLSQQDILDTLVLVCRIVINGHVKAGISTSTNYRASSTNLNSPYSNGASPSSASFASPALQSSSSLTEPYQRIDISSLEGMVNSSDDMRRTCRRPFGCAVVDISQLCKVGQSAVTTTELTMPIFVPMNEANFSTLHEDILASRIKEFHKSSKAEHISIGLRCLHEDVQNLARDHPSLMAGTSLTSRLGFPEVVLPGHHRSDLYIKLWSGDFPSLISTGKLKGLAVNVEVEAEVRTGEGTVVPMAISRGSGQPFVTRYTSIVMSNNLSPTWGDLLKVDISSERSQGCHLFFTIRNRKDRMSGTRVEKPVAFGYISLFGGDSHCLADGMHQVALYRYDPQWTSPGLYLSLPSIINDKMPLSEQNGTAHLPVPLRDSFAVRSFLCSTEITQDPTLLAILKWKTNVPTDLELLKNELNRLRYCPEHECVKMIRHIFNALFAVLSSRRNENGEVDTPAFSVLITLLSLVHDRRFEHFQPILDLYIEQQFCSTTAHTHLVRSELRLVENYGKADAAQDLRASIKVWPYLFKLIVKSRALQRAKEGDINITASHIESAFRRDLQLLLKAINSMMRASTPPSIIGTQALAIQHFAGIVPELLALFSSEEVTDAVIGFYDSIISRQGGITMNQVLLLGHIVSGPLFQRAGSRSILVPNVCRWLKPHLGNLAIPQLHDPKVAAKNHDSLRISHWESARLAVAVLAAMLDKIQQSLIDPAVNSNPHTLAQEHDNLEFILALLPRLIETYQATVAQETIELLMRHRGSSTVVQKEPVVFPAVHPTPLLLRPPDTGSSSETAPVMALKGEIAAVAIILVHIAPVEVLSNYLQGCLEVEGFDSFSKFIIRFFQLCRSILQQQAFPSSWLNISMLAHKSIVRIAGPIALLMQKHFIPPRDQAASFDVAIWRDFFEVMLRLLSSPSLVIEDFAPSRQRAVWRLAGDVRGHGSKILQAAWEALSWPEGVSKSTESGVGGYQAGLTNLVAPVLELCLSHHDELRNTSVQMLYSLLVTEFHVNGDFKAVEHEVLDRLDKLFSQRKGDEISRAFFVTQLRGLFAAGNSVSSLQAEVDAFLDSISQFLELLLSIRNLPEGEEWQDDRVIGTLRLMTFIEKRHRNIFIRYVHRLVDFHIASNQLTEAGLTLKLHADLYAFDPINVVGELPELGLPNQSEFNRKELLLLRVLEYLSRGQSYERAIAISKDLQVQYEQHVFAYQRLSELLVHQADLFASIVTRTRYFPQHFLVGFYGQGFPLGVQNKQYVYRAHDWEKFGSFCERMHLKHPQAQLIRGHEEVSLEMQGSVNRYLHVTAVDPEPDLNNVLLTNPSVLPAIRRYYEASETRTFSYTYDLDRVERTLASTSAKSAGSWSQKTILVCADAFPTILKRTEVLETRTIEISPLENAFVNVTKTSSELSGLLNRFTLTASQPLSLEDLASVNVNQFSMALNAAIDTGPAAGIPLYRQAFFDAAYVAAHSDQLDRIQELRRAINEQVRIIAKCLLLHHSLCPPDMVTFHESLIRFFETNFAPELDSLKPDIEYKATASASPISHQAGTNGIFDVGYAIEHQRTLSSSSLASSRAHLPPSFSNTTLNSPGKKLTVDNGYGIATSPSPVHDARFDTSLQDSSPSRPSESNTRAPSTPRANGNGVHFAPTPSYANDQNLPLPASSLSPKEENVSRPVSFLSRLSSIRKKRS